MIQSWTPRPSRPRIDVEEARKRVHFNGRKYYYEPSSAYKRMLGKLANRGVLIPPVQETILNEM